MPVTGAKNASIDSNALRKHGIMTRIVTPHDFVSEE
jgi:hypothetical protein